MAQSDDDTVEVLRAQAAVLDQEITELRRRLADAPKRMRALEERLLETKGQLAHAVSQNEKLSYTLREAREHIATLRDEVDKLSQPPSAYGVVVGKNEDGTVDVLTSGRKMRVGMHPDVDHDTLERGAEVVLNESFNVVSARVGEAGGEVVTIKELMDDGVRAMVIGRADEERVCELADNLRGVHLRSGDTMRLDPRSNLLLEKLPRPEVEDLLLEEVPDISYEDIGGLAHVYRGNHFLHGAHAYGIAAQCKYHFILCTGFKCRAGYRNINTFPYFNIFFSRYIFYFVDDVFFIGFAHIRKPGAQFFIIFTNQRIGSQLADMVCNDHQVAHLE